MLKEKYLKLKQVVFPNLFRSRNMIYLLKHKGVKVGRGTIFYSPGKSSIDLSRPCLLEFGEYCKIAGCVVILTHDYSRSVLRRVYGEILGEAKKLLLVTMYLVG